MRDCEAHSPRLGTDQEGLSQEREGCHLECERSHHLLTVTPTVRCSRRRLQTVWGPWRTGENGEVTVRINEDAPWCWFGALSPSTLEWCRQLAESWCEMEHGICEQCPQGPRASEVPASWKFQGLDLTEAQGSSRGGCWSERCRLLSWSPEAGPCPPDGG